MKYKSLKRLGIKDKGDSKKSFGNKVLVFFNKLMTAVLICLVCLIVMEYSPKFKKIMNEKVLGENISFGYFGKLYNKYFGDVLPTGNNNIVSVFNEKITYSNCEKYLDGFKLSVSTNYLVPVIKDGVVVFVGEKDSYGSVVIVEQTDGVNVIYGNINNSNVKLYDHVTSGSFLGEAKSDILYLVLEKDGEYLDIETYLS